MAASKECCLKKTVGGDLYLLVDYDPARTDDYMCKDGCIYHR
jgi:hypothetical protein